MLAKSANPNPETRIPNPDLATSDNLSSGNAADSAAEHRAAADLLIAEQAEQLAESGKNVIQIALYHSDRLIAPADSRAAVGEDRINLRSIQKILQQSAKTIGTVGDHCIMGDGMAVLDQQLFNPRAALVGRFVARVAERDDGAARHDVLR